MKMKALFRPKRLEQVTPPPKEEGLSPQQYIKLISTYKLVYKICWLFSEILQEIEM
jgi:hypothetical protein